MATIIINKGYYWVIASLLLVTIAQLAMKVAMIGLPAFSLAGLSAFSFTELYQLVVNHSLAIIWLMVGLMGYLLSMACWFMALHYLPLNRAYPLLGLSYVLVYLAASCLPMLTEQRHLINDLGIVFILLGVFLVTSQAKNKT